MRFWLIGSGCLWGGGIGFIGELIFFVLVLFYRIKLILFRGGVIEGINIVEYWKKN